MPSQNVTLADFLDTYEREYLPHQARNTQRRKRQQFAVVRQALGDVPLTALTPEQLRQWRDTLAVGRKGSTVTIYLQALSSVLTVAAKHYRLLAENPMHLIQKLPEGEERVRFLDAEEQARLFRACQQSRSRYLYPLVLLAVTTGARKMELLMLRWADLQLQEGLMRLARTKTRLRQGVPMPRMTVAVLLEWQREGQGAYVFPGERSTPPAIWRPWARARDQAGLVDFRFHDLRHTAASYLAQSGVRIEDIADLLGHKSLETTRRYRHLSPAYTAELVERMAQRFVVVPQA